LIGLIDDPASFYEPERFQAQLVWFGGPGFLEYRFPYHPRRGQSPLSLQVSMEICSEAAPHHDDWPSDIFLEINGVEIGRWTSPGDFGGERGALTPAWWGEWNSQYGLLKTWRVDQGGSFIDGRHLSDVGINDLRLDQQCFIQMRVGVKPDAAHVGGLNIFGRDFGNHAQDIMLRVSF
jgi:predicted transcriptional regulator